MKRIIDQAIDLGQLISVVFTGGEPLLKQQDVLETIRYASAHNLWTRIVTNSYWATSPEIAVKKLRRLKEAGLSELNLSCDDLHQENIPIERVKNAFLAAKGLDLPVLVAHKKVRNGKITSDSIAELLGLKLTEFVEGGENPITDLYCSSLTVPIGLGSSTLNQDDYIIYPTCTSAFMTPCNSVLSAVIVSPEKDVKICCGMINQRVPEITIGNLGQKALAEIVYEGNQDLIANWLALEGPDGLKRFIQEKAPEVRFQEMYVNHCHLCNDILTRSDTRAVLMQHAHEKAESLSLQRGFLEAVRFADVRHDCLSPAT